MDPRCEAPFTVGTAWFGEAMSISDLRSGRASGRPSPAEVLTEAVVAVRRMDGTLWAAQSDDELVSVVAQAEALRSALAAVQAGAVAEADARGLARRLLHYGSTGDWLTHAGGLRWGQGRRLVALARALTGPLAATRQALAAGQVSPEQAEVIANSIEELPSGAAVRRRGETTLIEQATSLDATDLARSGRYLVHVVDPGAGERRHEAALARDERGCHRARFLSIVGDGAGGVRLRGRGSAEDGALLRAALLPLTTPSPAVDDDDGRRVHDPRDHGARLWDALVMVADRALTTAVPSGTHGAPPRLTVTVPSEALRAGLEARGLTGATASTDGTSLSWATVRRLACDAEIIPAVLGGKGEVLDVGRARRSVTPAIWAALVLRDQHCAFPGCHRAPLMCHAHHIEHWADGGPTTLDNLVLLCGHHHRVLHSTPWQVRLHRDDHVPEFRAPPKAGAARPWIRHRPRRE